MIQHKISKQIIENNPVYGKYYHSIYGFLAVIEDKIYFFYDDIAEDVTSDWEIFPQKKYSEEELKTAFEQGRETNPKVYPFRDYYEWKRDWFDKVLSK